MRESLQNLHEMMLSNEWHANVACNPPPSAHSPAVNMPAPPLSQHLLPGFKQTISPLPENTMTAPPYSSPRILGCLRPMKQPGTPLIISFIHIASERHPSLLLCFPGLKLVPLTYFVLLRIWGVMLSVISEVWFTAVCLHCVWGCVSLHGGRVLH